MSAICLHAGASNHSWNLWRWVSMLWQRVPSVRLLQNTPFYRACPSCSGLRCKLCCHLNYQAYSKMLVFANISAFEPHLDVYSDCSELRLQNRVVFHFWGVWLWKYAFGPTAGIPAPIYFGAIIDTTCLKWGQKRCGGIGACRIYNTTAYR